MYRTCLVLGDKKASKRSKNKNHRTYDPRGLHATEYDIWLTPKEGVRGIDRRSDDDRVVRGPRDV